MNLPDCLHRGLLDGIIIRISLDFIEHDNDVHQDEEEYSSNDSFVLHLMMKIIKVTRVNPRMTKN